MVRGEQRLEDLAVAVRQIAAQQVVGRAEAAAIGGAEPLADQLAPLAARQQQQRVVAHLVGDLRLDELVVEVRVGLLRAAVLEAAAEADAALGQLLRREDPVELVERALVERRVVLHRPLQAGDEGRLGAAVRAVQQDEAVGAPLAREVRDQPVDRRLHLLLPHQRVLAAVPGAVEQAPARHRRRAASAPSRCRSGRTRRARTGPPTAAGGAGSAREQRQVFVERDDAPVAREAVAHLARRVGEPALGVERLAVAIRRPRRPPPLGTRDGRDSTLAIVAPR